MFPLIFWQQNRARSVDPRFVGPGKNSRDGIKTGEAETLELQELIMFHDLLRISTMYNLYYIYIHTYAAIMCIYIYNIYNSI